MPAFNSSGVPGTRDAQKLNEALFVEDGAWPFMVSKGRRAGSRFLASALLKRCASLELGRNDTLCVATTQRSVVGAAVLSSLAGGPRLVLPASLSQTAIAAACGSLSAKVILTSEKNSTPEGFQIIFTEHLEQEADSSPLALDRPLDDVLLYLYTGGSTGRPVVWSKSTRNLFGEVAFLRSRFQINPSDVMVAVVPPFHIYGLLYSVLLPLMTGATILDESPFYPNEIVATLVSEKATVFIAGPMHYRVLSEKDFSLNQLRLAFSSGGFLEESYGKCFSQCSGVGVTEIYGSTETGGIASRCRHAGEQAWTSFPVVRWRVGDDNRLAVNSPFLSRNLDRDTDGFYLTGDRVRSRGTDCFELIGRIDGLVKVGGKRVDLLEVESALRALPGVSDAFVLAVPTPESRGNLIVALVVSEAPAEKLTRLLHTRLDAAAIPRRMVCVDKIPTTTLGKRDHHAALEILGYSM